MVNKFEKSEESIQQMIATDVEVQSIEERWIQYHSESKRQTTFKI